MALKYAEFLDVLLEARGLKKTELAEKIGATPEQVYEFFRGEHCPNAGLAKAIEKALGCEKLDPSYYGWGDSQKPSAK